jgi:hypothetical protein
MSNEQASPSPATEQEAAGRCVCHEVLDHLGKCFEVSPAVRQHLTNSRVEFLKAIRAVIDQRIEHLSSTEPRGSRIAVE